MRKIQKQGVAADGIAAVGLGNQNVGFTRRKGGRSFAASFFGTAGEGQNEYKKKEKCQEMGLTNLGEDVYT